MDINTILNNPTNIVLAVILVDIIALVLAKTNLVGKVLQDWYQKFTIGAFVADVSSISFGIFLSLLIFKYALPPTSFNLGTFILSVIIIQLIHDLLFAFLIINYPKNNNNMIDLFKSYINENDWKILLVDASMMTLSVLLIYLFYQVDNVIIYTLLAFSLYFAMFFIY
jgi:hypothetical protein